MKKLPGLIEGQSFLDPEGNGWQRVDEIAARIGFIRGTWVILDEHLAEIFDLPVSQLIAPFVAHEPVPGEFRFPTDDRPPTKGRRGEPNYAFTEHGAFLAALLLDRPDAAALGVQVVRAFIRRRQAIEDPMAN